MTTNNNDERRLCDPPVEEPEIPDMEAAEDEYWSNCDDRYEDYKSSGERAWWDRR